LVPILSFHLEASPLSSERASNTALELLARNRLPSFAAGNCGEVAFPVSAIIARWTWSATSVTIGLGCGCRSLSASGLARGAHNAACCNLDRLHIDVRLSGSDIRRARVHQSNRLRDSHALVQRADCQRF